MEGCESFVDDLIGCRVLYSVRDALLHRSLEIQPWHFPDSLFIKKKRLAPIKRSSFFFFAESRLLGRVKNSLQFFGHSGRTTRRIPPKLRPHVLWSLGYLALNFGGTFSRGFGVRQFSVKWGGVLEKKNITGRRKYFFFLDRNNIEKHCTHA